MAQNLKMTLKDFYYLTPDQQQIEVGKVIKIAKVFMTSGDSITVCIHKTYRCSDHSLQLTNFIIRSSDLMNFYHVKHRLKRELRRFDMKEFLTTPLELRCESY